MSNQIQNIKDKFFQVYGIRLNESDVFSYCLRHAGYVESKSLNDMARMFSKVPFRKTYRVRCEDMLILNDLYAAVQTKQISRNSFLAYIVYQVALRDELYRPTYKVELFKPKVVAKPIPNKPDTLSYLMRL